MNTSLQPDKPTTLADLWRHYAAIRLVGGSERTHQKFEIAIRHFERALGREAFVTDLNDMNMSRMMQYAVDRGCANTSVNGYRAKIHALWVFAAKQGWLTAWPNGRKMREPKRTPVVWSQSDLQKLWNTLAMQPGFIGGLPASLWWQIYHCIAWDTGERHASRMALTWGDFVDFDAGTGIFPAVRRKAQQSDLPFRLHAFTVSLLRQAKELGATRPTPWPLDRDYFWLAYTNLLKSGGLPTDRNHKSHCLRRSFATYMVLNGIGRAEVSEALGQSGDPRVLNCYLNNAVLPSVAAHEVLPRMWEGDPRDPRARRLPAPESNGGAA